MNVTIIQNNFLTYLHIDTIFFTNIGTKLFFETINKNIGHKSYFFLYLTIMFWQLYKEEKMCCFWKRARESNAKKLFQFFFFWRQSYYIHFILNKDRLCTYLIWCWIILQMRLNYLRIQKVFCFRLKNSYKIDSGCIYLHFLLSFSPKRWYVTIFANFKHFTTTTTSTSTTT